MVVFYLHKNIFNLVILAKRCKCPAVGAISRLILVWWNCGVDVIPIELSEVFTAQDGFMPGLTSLQIVGHYNPVFLILSSL